jgi:hypothetical protein
MADGISDWKIFKRLIFKKVLTISNLFAILDKRPEDSKAKSTGSGCGLHLVN